MLDRQYSFPDTLVTELMQEVLLYPALRNEVYAQLIKQLTNNAEHIESWHRGWTLMCIMVSRSGTASGQRRDRLRGFDQCVNRADIAILSRCFFLCRWTPFLLCLIF